MSKQKKEQELVIGGVPRADLLPPEVRQAVRDRRTTRYLAYGVVVAIALSVIGTVYAFGNSIASQANLAFEKDRTVKLLEEQEQYAVARATAAQIDLIIEAREQAMATEINWNEYFKAIEATLPEGVVIEQMIIDSVSPIDELPVTEIPLQTGWVALLTVKAASATVPDVEKWLDDLKGVKGFAGVAPPVEVKEGGTAAYTVTMQILVNTDAYALRFAEKDIKGDKAGSDEENVDAEGDK